LSGEVVLTLDLPDLGQYLERLAFRVQGLSLLAGVDDRPADGDDLVPFVFLGDGR
jgi:hypothetical protein